MRTTGNLDLDTELQARLKASQCNVWSFLYRYNGTTWDEILDLDTRAGITWNKNSKKVKYANYAFLPEPSDITFQVINEKGKYSEGSGTSVEGWFDNDTKIKLLSGYLIEEPYSTSTTNVPIGSFVDGGDGYYYYQAEIDRVHKKYNSFKIYYDNDIELEYRLYRHPKHTEVYDEWTLIDESSSDSYLEDKTGDLLEDQFNENLIENSIHPVTLPVTRYKYLQLRIPSADIVDLLSVDIIVDDYFVPLYTDVFYLDTPQYTEPSDPAIPMVKCKGRDSLKYILNSEVQPFDYSGLSIDALIKKILDYNGIKYTASSITTFPGIPTRDNDVNIDSPKSSQWYLERYLQVAAIEGNYNVYMDYDSVEDDNVFFVQPKPDEFVADFVFDYRNYRGIGARKKNHDNILRRITVQTEEQPVDEEISLYNNTFAINQTDLKVNLGTGLSFYHRIEVSGSGTLDDIKIENDHDVVQSYAYLTLTAPLTITIYGCPWESFPPNWSGEGISADNATVKKGNEVKILNPFLNSSSEAKQISEFLITNSATPIDEATNIDYPYNNLFLQVNDMTLLWSRWIFLDDLRYITGIGYKWAINKGIKHSSSFNVSDSGKDFFDEYDFIYDEDPILNYDIGILYDMGISTPQSTDAEIDAATKIVHNVSFS
jgi:hypothetical protein